MAISESILKLKEMTADEIFDYLRGINYYAEEYEDIVEQFESYVMNNSLECSKKFPIIRRYEYDMQQAFLIRIEHAASIGRPIDLEPFVKHAESRKLNAESLAFDDLMSSVFKIIRSGLDGNVAEPKLKDRICRQVFRAARCKSMESEEAYPESDADSLTIAFDDDGGISFDLLFKYVEWAKYSTLTADVRKILEDYANNHIPHTIARHAAIGSYLPLLHRLDSEFTKELTKKITRSRRYKIAFWDGFVSYSVPDNGILESMPDWYNEFLNGEIAKDLRGRLLYLSSMQHVTAGYLRDAGCYDDIFEEFVNKAGAEMINKCSRYVSRMLENNEGAGFKDKLRRLWKDQRFIENADLEKWFWHSPLEKKESIELLLNYLKRKEKVAYARAKDLDEYVDECPIKAAQCLYYMIKKCDSPGSPGTIERQLEKLLAKNDHNIAKEFLRIEKLIKSQGRNVEYSKSAPYNVRIKRR